jgi:hypothetical protein
MMTRLGSEAERLSGGIVRREELMLNSGSWTILSARAKRTPGFASPPHDGFAFIGTAPEAAAPGYVQDWDQRSVA